MLWRDHAARIVIADDLTVGNTLFNDVTERLPPRLVHMNEYESIGNYHASTLSTLLLFDGLNAFFGSLRKAHFLFVARWLQEQVTDLQMLEPRIDDYDITGPYHVGHFLTMTPSGTTQNSVPPAIICQVIELRVCGSVFT